MRKILPALAAAFLIVLGLVAPAMAADHPAEAAPKLRILILGGTGFIGPWEVEAARARGHEVTLFNRGKSKPGLFADLEHLVGDRDPDKDEGLKALEGREFDVVIDNSGYYPRHVKASAELLAPHVKQYIYVSSISAYALTEPVDQDEDAPLATMDDPTLETMGENYQYYGALKALCEQAALAAMPGRTTVVRPGFIVGPGDHTYRFSYWPLRIRQGGDVAVPGDPEDPIQVIDVRDLTEWIIRLAESGTTGVFNACGPATTLTMGDAVKACQATVGGDATITWLGTAFGEAHPDVAFPIWAPREGEYAGFHRFSNRRAVAAGLTFRPIEDTIKALVARFDALPDDERAKVMERIPVADEAALVAEAHAAGR